jgi:hypothetical protein
MAAAMIVTAARGRLHPLLVAFFRPFSIHPIEAANSRPGQEATMADALQLQQTYRRIPGGVRAAIHAILSAVTAEHTLALRAATKAALPRQRLAEVRAMYVSPQEHRWEDDATAQSTKSDS